MKKNILVLRRIYIKTEHKSEKKMSGKNSTWKIFEKGWRKSLVVENVGLINVSSINSA